MHQPSRHLYRAGAIMLLAASSLLIGGAKPAAAPYIVRGDGVVPVIVGGVAGRMRISPWAPAAPTLNPDYAARIGLRGGLFGFQVAVGSVKVSGRTSVTRLEFGAAKFKRRVVWFEKPYAPNADGAVGPGGLPVDVLRFELRDAKPGERTIALPLVQQLFRPAVAQIMVGGRTISVLFDPQHVRTLATAGAGAALAVGLGGEFFGPAERAEVAFGIDRPVRAMRLTRPVQIGALSFDRLFVRVADSGSIAGIPDADADPEEIVVNASKSSRRDTLIVGRDQLARCSSIVFDKPAKQIRLTCG